MGMDELKKKPRPKAGVKSLFSGNNSGAGGKGYDWGEVDANDFHRLIDLVTARGGAIRFGYTRDGGAGAIGIYYGDARDTVYIRPGQDFGDATEHIREYFESLPSTQGRAPD